MASQQFPKIPENRPANDKELLAAVRYAALVMTRWKRLDGLSEKRGQHHRDATLAIKEELKRVLVDKEKTPMFSDEEFAFIFLGVTLLTLYEDIFPQLLDKEVKKLEEE